MIRVVPRVTPRLLSITESAAGLRAGFFESTEALTHDAPAKTLEEHHDENRHSYSNGDPALARLLQSSRKVKCHYQYVILLFVVSLMLPELLMCE